MRDAGIFFHIRKYIRYCCKYIYTLINAYSLNVAQNEHFMNDIFYGGGLIITYITIPWKHINSAPRIVHHLIF